MSKNVSINGYMSVIFSPAKANNFPQICSEPIPERPVWAEEEHLDNLENYAWLIILTSLAGRENRASDFLELGLSSSVLLCNKYHRQSGLPRKHFFPFFPWMYQVA